MEDSAEVQRRTKVALAAIKHAFGTEEDAFGATLFVSHHLGEIDSAYWQEHLGTAQPEPARVLDLLELQSHWGEDDYEDDEDEGGGIDVFDFTLPGNITDYVISVHFDEDGEVDEISMES
jgi:hypothetical protein